MIDIIKLLKANDKISDYQVNTEKTESYESFFVHRKLETVRSTDTTDVSVTIYCRHDGKIGNSKFSVYESTTEKEFLSKLDVAIEKCLIIFNKDFSLPSNEKVNKTLNSNFENQPFSELSAKISKAVFDADNVEGGSINALEIFINKKTVSVVNSRGIDKCETKYKAMIEAIPTFTADTSVELYENFVFNEFNEKEITSEIARKMQEVKLRFTAKAPVEKLNCPILLRDAEVYELLETLEDNVSYPEIYHHANVYKQGDYIQKNPTGDKISLTMRGEIKGCVNSSVFDFYGSKLTDTKIFDNGKVVGSQGATKFAQYLNQPETGDLRCVDVDTGSLTDKELENSTYLELVSLSGLQLDLYTDYIGGEIRLAYLNEKGKITPVTSISISGKLSEALNTIKLYDKKSLCRGYYGPKYALLDKIEIV